MVEISIKKAVQVNGLITYESLWSGGNLVATPPPALLALL